MAQQTTESIGQSLRKLETPVSHETSASQELLEILANTTPELSQAILQQLRVTPSPQYVLALLKGDITSMIQPSGHKAARAVTPPVFSPRELQLMIQHPSAYPRLDPDNLKHPTGIPFELLPPRATPGLYGTGSSSEAVTQKISDASSGEPSGLQNSPEASGSTTRSPPSFGPSDLPDYADPRLANFDVQFWTTVSVESSFVAEVISTYLEIDHAVLGLFEASNFLSALVQYDVSICSSFEVNAFLAFASVSRS